MALIRLYNTASRALEEFTPPPPHVVTMYNCGPTVYNYAHIGNLRAYVFADVLRRTFEQNGYVVKQIVNITDVGHLVSDDDEGEDKIELGAKREGKSVEYIIGRYSDAFFADLEALNIKEAAKYPRATKYIDEQKALIETLADKGYTYTTTDGIYFDTQKFPRYADFAKLDIEGMKAGARIAIGEKRSPTDFALWKFSPEDSAKREQEWLSPLGLNKMGFPGWHVECSAIAMKELGETIDIHTGGIDHIPVHHTNEIAQSECATGKPFSRYWMHSAFMNVDGQKMSKSLGNTYRLSDLKEHGISPMAFRYWLLTAHYRTQVNFTWEALEGAKNALLHLTNIINNLPNGGNPNEKYISEFTEAICADLDTPRAVALFWDLMKDNEVSDKDKRATFIAFNEIFGFSVDIIIPVRTVTLKLGMTYTIKGEQPTTKNVEELLVMRQDARNTKNWAEADRLRDELRKLGYEIKDTPEGQGLEQI